MGKKVKYISALLSYVLIICLIVGLFPATSFAKSSIPMTEATKPTKKIVETTEAEKTQKQKTMQVTDVKTKKTREVEIEEEPETETLPTTIQTTQTPITEVTTVNSLAENQDTSETIPHHKEFCDETTEAHTGWKKIDIRDRNLTGGKYYLDSDISLPSGALNVKGDVILCLNGYTIKLDEPSGDSCVIQVNEGTSLTLFDHSTNQGTISGVLYPSLEKKGAVCIDGGTFTMNGGRIADSMARAKNGGGVSVVNDGTFIMNNGTITNNRTSIYGGGVSVIDGTFTMNGGTISENKADNWEFGGGGVSVIDGTFTMNGGTISKNLGGFWGGGIFIYNSDVTINDGSIISDNTLQYGGDRPGGGGIYVATNSTLTINNGNISNNESSGCGGGIFAYNSILNISNSTIANNKITKKYTFGGGGGICLEGSTLNMKDSSISNNEGYYGGGVYVNTSVFNMKNGTITNNTAINNSLDYTGGGVYINQDSTSIFNISGSPIITKNAKDDSTNNVYLPKDKIINVVGELGEKANIGVTVEDLPTEENPLRKIAKGSNGYTILNDDKKKFTSDDPKYTTIFKDYAVHLGEAPDEKKVTFNYQYNEIKNVINVEVGKTVTEPDKPTRDGYTFGGWYEDENCIGNKWNFSTSVTKDITLYAKWTENEYNVTFNSQDGSPVDSQTIKENGKVTKPTDPTREGYTFGGWFTEDTCTHQYNFDTPVTSNITLYAKWTQEQYTVTFNSQDGSPVDSQTIKHGGKVTEPASNPTREGYTFGGWFTDKDCTDSNKWNFDTNTVTADITLYAKWTENEYTVTFNSQGGSTIEPKNVKHGNTVTKPDDPTKNGFTFDGWYKEQEYTTTWNFATPVTANMILYAKWIQNETPTPPEEKYTVTFDSQGGSNVTSQEVEKDKQATKPTNPTKNGFTFDGWFTEANCTNPYDFVTPVINNITLFAKWEENYYTVTFDSNRGSTVPEQTVKHDEKVQVPKDPTKDGYTFNGWFTDEACIRLYDFDKLVTNDIILYAKWTKNGTPQPTEYNVNFDSKGGTGVSSQIVKANQKAAKPDPDPTREGYTFDGWYQKEDFSGDKWDFYNDIVTENIILYAKWTEETTVDPTPPAEVNYMITFDSQGGSDVSTQTVEKGKTVAKPAAPTKTSFTFAGWFTDKACTQEYDFDTAVIADMTLFAKWEENKTTPSNPTLPTTKYYTVTFESNGGSAIPSQTISSGRTATMPQNPTKNDCEFLGWFVDKDFNEIYRFSTPITKDIIIYAKWKSDNYIVTFESNGGSEIPSQIIEAGKTATMPENPTKSDYEFLGWFADKDFNEIYHFSTPVIEDITIYAKWKSKIRSSGGGGGGGHYRTGTWVTEEPEKQYQVVKLGCPRDETCPLWKFTDVDRWAWYHDGSHYCVEHGLIVGTTNTTFSPHMPITRAMVVAILWRIEDKPLVNDVITFQDVNESEYYAEAVRWAAHNGIVSGYSRTVFAPDDSITREQMASILYRYTQYKNRDVSGRADISNYEDKNEISNYALTAIQWACDVGIINGINATTLSPKGTTTRAQAAQMFKAYLEQL